MVPPFPQEQAARVCRTMLKELAAGTLTLVRTGAAGTDRAHDGVMLGALVCRDGSGSEIVLKTVSGISHELRPAAPAGDGSIYVPPVVSAGAIAAALERNDKIIHELTADIKRLKAARRNDDGSWAHPGAQEYELILRRKALTSESLQAVFALYAFHCADGTVRTLQDICRERLFFAGKYGEPALPPVGTGDCCAPKLLDYAFARGLLPVSMCEVFYEPSADAAAAGTEAASDGGQPGGARVSDTARVSDIARMSGMQYPPCDERCGVVLPAMLGLEILYRDDDIIVVNKQSGVLSVPGRGPDKQDCIVNRVRRLFPHCMTQPSVHRLDMETSGLLVLAFNDEAHRCLCRQFEQGTVHKQYTALLDGNAVRAGIAGQGCMELYFRLDIDNRPHQIWDAEYGKKAVTQWQLCGLETYRGPDGAGRTVTRVLFTPHTGRTHQLRLAAADSHGFSMPIVGDTLYGRCAAGERLMLHACSLSFAHPADGRRMEFTCTVPF